MTLMLKSSAFENNAEIPVRYTCSGEDVSVPLNWEGVPEAARSLVLIVDDPDAPDPKAPKMVWVHWVLCNIPPDVNALDEHTTSATLPAGAIEGPPIGRHRYYHKLYALDTVLEGLRQPTKADVEAAMQGHIIAQAELIGTFKK